MAKIRLSGLTNYHLKAIMNWSVGSGTGDAVQRWRKRVLFVFYVWKKWFKHCCLFFNFMIMAVT